MLSLAGLPCSRQRIFRPFRLQPPAALPGTVGLGCFPPGLPRPFGCRRRDIPAWDKSVTRASPFRAVRCFKLGKLGAVLLAVSPETLVSLLAYLETSNCPASPFPRRLAKTAGRIEFACATDGTFTWGCSPPPLPRTQLPSVTGSQTDPDKDLHLAGSLRSKRTSAAVAAYAPT